MQKQLAELVKKEMSRKEFLAAIGLALGSMLGLNSLIKLLSHDKKSSSDRAYNYDGGPYGK